MSYNLFLICTATPLPEDAGYINSGVIFSPAALPDKQQDGQNLGPSPLPHQTRGARIPFPNSLFFDCFLLILPDLSYGLLPLGRLHSCPPGQIRPGQIRWLCLSTPKNLFSLLLLIVKTRQCKQCLTSSWMFTFCWAC